jgi:hypothetical protein
LWQKLDGQTKVSTKVLLVVCDDVAAALVVVVEIWAGIHKTSYANL